ncbi:MAG: hypothetical protein ABRQ39_31265 [Candidatus Eremiobacterota bacterium]
MRKNIGLIELIAILCIIVIAVRVWSYKKPDNTQPFTIKATPVSNSKKTNITSKPDKMSRHDKELLIIYRYHDACQKQFGEETARQKAVDWLNKKVSVPSLPVPSGVQKASLNTIGGLVITFYDGLTVIYCNSCYGHDKRTEELRNYCKEQSKKSGKQIQKK